MPTLTGDFVARTEDATKCADLHSFKCGPGTIFPKAEKEVDNIVSVCCAGVPPRQNTIIRVTREEPPGAIVGVTGLERGGLTIQHPKYTPHAYKDAAYVAVIGLSEHYRDDQDSFRTKYGGRLGDFLLHDLLLHVKKTWRGGMPWVLALVDPANNASRLLFERHDFELFIDLGPGSDALFRRPKNLKVPPLDGVGNPRLPAGFRSRRPGR
jgi:hypothetical protein